MGRFVGMTNRQQQSKIRKETKLPMRIGKVYGHAHNPPALLCVSGKIYNYSDIIKEILKRENLNRAELAALSGVDRYVLMDTVIRPHGPAQMGFLGLYRILKGVGYTTYDLIQLCKELEPYDWTTGLSNPPPDRHKRYLPDEF